VLQIFFLDFIIILAPPLLSDSEFVEALAMRKGLKFVKVVSFMNLIIESKASNVVLALSAHQQSPTYVGSIIKDSIVSVV